MLVLLVALFVAFPAVATNTGRKAGTKLFEGRNTTLEIGKSWRKLESC
jgi:hypothetical protein